MTPTPLWKIAQALAADGMDDDINRQVIAKIAADRAAYTRTHQPTVGHRYEVEEYDGGEVGEDA